MPVVSTSEFARPEQGDASPSSVKASQSPGQFVEDDLSSCASTLTSGRSDGIRVNTSDGSVAPFRRPPPSMDGDCFDNHGGVPVPSHMRCAHVRRRMHNLLQYS
ncbi:hypothetical protein FOZ63_026108 [Perkinsus olseni]|uniref:Uncharacterized protein n=1 Tax=Perkinsus olseni TaxID=32597 RepID=A0A7J6Q5W9_PEROL|nr:hypothetical protein FOZ63_026108 [Perkinsus olseni]KAF4738012.1 hypothetical protein FOZ62_011135 [Perkinsus olseni]